MNSIHTLEKRDKDRDLDRILHLYDIVKRYEFLVEYLLSSEHIVDVEDFDMHEYLHNIECSIITDLYSKNKNILELSRRTKRSRSHISMILAKLGLHDYHRKYQTAKTSKQEYSKMEAEEV